MYLSFNEKLRITEDYLKTHKIKKGKMIHKGFDINKWIKELNTIYTKGDLNSDGIYMYKGNSLLLKQIEKIKSLGLNLDLNINLDFNNNFAIMKKYYKEKHRLPDSKCIKYCNVEIGKWTCTIKKILEKGELQEDGSFSFDKYILKKEELDMLNEFHFLDLFYNNKDVWDIYYEAFVDYLKEYKIIPKQSTIYRDLDLGYWYQRQKLIILNGIIQEDGSIKYGNNRLTKDKVDKFNSIDYQEFMPKIFCWDDRFELLDDFTKTNNRLPRIHEAYKGFCIGMWFYDQKRIAYCGELIDGIYKYKDKSISIEQFKKLESISNEFSMKRKYAWDSNYELLCDFKKEFNRLPKRNEVYKGFCIGIWLYTNISIFNNGIELDDGSVKYYDSKLSKEKIKKLESQEVKWVTKTSRYNKKEIKDTETMKARRRYLISQLNRIRDIEFNSKKDVEDFNNNFYKLIYTKNQNNK